MLSETLAHNSALMVMRGSTVKRRCRRFFPTSSTAPDRPSTEQKKELPLVASKTSRTFTIEKAARHVRAGRLYREGI